MVGCQINFDTCSHVWIDWLVCWMVGVGEWNNEHSHTPPTALLRIFETSRFFPHIFLDECPIMNTRVLLCPLHWRGWFIAWLDRLIGVLDGSIVWMDGLVVWMDRSMGVLDGLLAWMEVSLREWIDGVVWMDRWGCVAGWFGCVAGWFGCVAGWFGLVSSGEWMVSLCEWIDSSGGSMVSLCDWIDCLVCWMVPLRDWIDRSSFLTWLCDGGGSSPFSASLSYSIVWLIGGVEWSIAWLDRLIGWSRCVAG